LCIGHPAPHPEDDFGIGQVAFHHRDGGRRAGVRVRDARDQKFCQSGEGHGIGKEVGRKGLSQPFLDGQAQLSGKQAVKADFPQGQVRVEPLFGKPEQHRELLQQNRNDPALRLLGSVANDQS